MNNTRNPQKRQKSPYALRVDGGTPLAAKPQPGSSTGDTAALLLQGIRHRRQQVSEQVRTLRRSHNRLTYGGIACSSLATLIAGWAAAAGPMIGEGFPAWQATCGVVAVFTAVAGTLGGVQQSANMPEKLGKLVAYAAKLTALEVALTVRGRDPSEVARDYETLIAENGEPDL